jgi:hypothetical protein
VPPETFGRLLQVLHPTIDSGLYEITNAENPHGRGLLAFLFQRQDAAVIRW